MPNLCAVVTLFEAIGYCCFGDVSSQRYGEVIINDDHNVHHLLYGPHVPNLGAVVTLFEAIGYCCF